MSLFRFIRSQGIVVTVSLILLIQLMNLSIDPTDVGKEDLTKNEIESIVELVTEHFLGHKDLIDESDEDDQQSLRCEMQIMLFPGIQSIAFENKPVISAKPLPTEYNLFFEIIPKTILTPPPQA